ncbi:MAG TPA: hypothetical protein VIK89_04615, partial [Cytophagaceae bacterium]
YPESAEIHNNLGILYNETKLLDSTVYYFNRAKAYASSSTEHVPIANLIGILGKTGFLNEADSIAKNHSFESDLPYINNKLAINTRLGIESDKPLTKSFLPDSILSKIQFAYLNNYTLNTLKNPDTSVLGTIANFSKYSGNQEFSNELKMLEAYKAYYTGDKAWAKSIMDLLRNLSSTPQQYSKIMGTWMLELRQHELAVEYFKDFRNLPDIPNKLNLGIALLKSGNTNEGLEVLNELKEVKEEGSKEIIEDLLLIFTTHDFNKVMSWEGSLRYQYLHYKKHSLTKDQLSTLFQSFSDANLKTLAGVELMDYYLNLNQPEEALTYWNIINKQNSAGEQAIREANYQHLVLLLQQQNWDELTRVLPEVAIPEERKFDLNWFKALTAEAKGDTAAAREYFNEILNKNPFAEKAIVSATEFFNKRGQELYAYEKLLEALKLNPVSKELQIAYFLQSLKLNLTSYAESALQDLKPVLQADEYAKYKQLLDQALNDETL